MGLRDGEVGLGHSPASHRAEARRLLWSMGLSTKMRESSRSRTILDRQRTARTGLSIRRE